MNTFTLTISSPDGIVFQREAVKLSVRGTEGELAVMAGHIPFVTAVKECEWRAALPDNTERTGHTSGGILSVSDKEVILLSDCFTR